MAITVHFYSNGQTGEQTFQSEYAAYGFECFLDLIGARYERVVSEQVP